MESLSANFFSSFVCVCVRACVHICRMFCFRCAEIQDDNESFWVKMLYQHMPEYQPVTSLWLCIYMYIYVCICIYIKRRFKFVWSILCHAVFVALIYVDALSIVLFIPWFRAPNLCSFGFLAITNGILPVKFCMYGARYEPKSFAWNVFVCVAFYVRNLILKLRFPSWGSIWTQWSLVCWFSSLNGWSCISITILPQSRN